LGNAHRDAGELDSALAAFEKAIELQPNYAEAHHNLGVSLRLQHRPKEALEHYETAQRLGLDGSEMRHNLGNAYMDLQQPERAIDAYRGALAKDATNLDTHRNLNSLLWQQDHLDDYLKSYRDALVAYPENEPLRLAYAAALTQQEAYAEAEEVLRQAFHHSRGSSSLKSLLAYAFEGQGRWDEALRMHAAAVDTRGSIPNHRISYGRALLARHRPDEALIQLRAAAALVPFNQRALAYLALCWRLLGDERDEVLNDYADLVRAYELPVPPGYRDGAQFIERLKSVIEPLHIAKRHPAEQTLRGGTQTSGNLFDRRDAEISALIAALEHCIGDYIGRFPHNDAHPLFSRRSDKFAFAASWSVRLAPGGYHTMHTHPLGWISSAYYVDVPPEIVETDACGGGIQFGKPDIDIGPQGEARRKIQPAPGMLVLFPSYMWHGTVPFESAVPRMTVAFDVVPSK
jgi:uncharacterized protein (TIGR02466 family)